MLIDMVVLGFICVILAPVGPFFKTTVQSLLRRLRLIHAIASAAERLRCVLGMLNSLEVKVLWPT